MVRFAAQFAAVAAVCAALGYVAGSVASGGGGKRVPLAATKFEFSVTEIRTRVGAPVTLVLSSADFIHGFSIPDFGVRVDLVPGKTVELTLTPDRAGRFVFLCDNFCGEGHEEMAGVLVVTAD
jgi:cytochrome c oxidase subunit 2